MGKGSACLKHNQGAIRLGETPYGDHLVQVTFLPHQYTYRAMGIVDHDRHRSRQLWPRLLGDTKDLSYLLFGWGHRSMLR